MTRTVKHYINDCRNGTIITASEREYQALRLAAAGLGVDDIAKIMGIYRSTTSTYIARWMQRSGAHNKAMLAVWALQMGVVSGSEIWEM